MPRPRSTLHTGSRRHLPVPGRALLLNSLSTTHRTDPAHSLARSAHSLSHYSAHQLQISMAHSRRHHLLLLLPTAMAAACFILATLLVLCAAPAHGARVLLPTPGGAGAGTKAQQGGTSGSSNATSGEEYLAPHNQARAAVGVAPLRWSADLASAAAKTVAQQQRQGGCKFADMGASPYGANQGWASYRARPAEVVALWVAEGRYYTHANNTCAAGRQCGTYTQVVWRRTTDVGCAQASCATGATLTLCLYDPHGNVQGQSPY